jgi:hypothetical protein
MGSESFSKADADLSHGPPERPGVTRTDETKRAGHNSDCMEKMVLPAGLLSRWL